MTVKDLVTTMKNNKDIKTTDSIRILFHVIGFIALLIASPIFFGCSEGQEDSSCLTRLDNNEFQSVADDSSCSNYERGSAELGLAGFLFAAFMKEDADSDFPGVLGLTSSGCSTTGSDALGSQSYNSIYQKHYLNAQYFTRTLPSASARTAAETEISLFATLGEIIVQTYCQMDANLDGEITDAENESFSKIDLSGEVGSSELVPLNIYQIIDSTGDAWLYNQDASPDNCKADPYFEGVWNNTSSSCSIVALISDSANWTSLSVIVKVEDLQQLFVDGTLESDVTEPLDFLSLYTNRTNLLRQDLASLGVEEDHDFYENISETVDEMDNGGTCNNESVQVLDLFTTIITNAPHYAFDETSDLSGGSLQNYNTISIDELSQIDSTETSANIIQDCRDDLSSDVCDNLSARLIYSIDASNDSGFYKNAKTGIRTTLRNLGVLTLENPDSTDDSTSPTLSPVTAGDENIALKELLCLE